MTSGEADAESHMSSSSEREERNIRTIQHQERDSEDMCGAKAIVCLDWGEG